MPPSIPFSSVKILVRLMTNGSSGFSGARDASGPDFHAVPREDGTKDSALGERDRRGLDVRAFCFVFLGDEGGNEMVGA